MDNHFVAANPYHSPADVVPTNPSRSHRHSGDRDEIESPEDGWSGPESGNDGIDQNGANVPRGVKRKRPITVSCELCKQRKVKCDRAQPSCGWCARNNQPCEYKERKKPGLRAGYGRELEQRLDRLEDSIHRQALLIETHIIQNQPHLNHDYPRDAPSYSSPSEPSAVHGPSPRTALFMQENSSNLPASHRVHGGTSTLSQDASLSSPVNAVNAAVNNEVQRHLQNGLPPASVLPRVVEPSHSDYSHNDPSFKVQPAPLYPTQQQSISDPDLPPYDLLYALALLYFDHINTWCPILHRGTTLDTLFGTSPSEEEDRMLLYAIVATTLRFSTDHRLNDDNRKHYYNSSKQKVMLYGLDNSSVKALQALVILALDFVGCSNGPPGWKLLALIARSVVQLGLAGESTSTLAATMFPSIYTLRANVLPDAKTWIEDESRRRLFWMVYLLDRYSTIATAFDFALNDSDIDRRLPCKDDFFIKNQPVETRWFDAQERTDYNVQRENVGSFGFYMEIIGILSRIHLFLKRPVDISDPLDVERWQTTYRKLDNELSTWEIHLPKEYAYNNASRLFMSKATPEGVRCGWVMLHATYQTTVIRLHSSAAYPTTRSTVFTPSFGASQRCLFAADNIHSLTRLVVDNKLLDKLGPPFAFTLWVSARLLLVHGSTMSHTLNPNVDFFVDKLRRMGKHWPVAERYSTILQRVLDEYAEYKVASSATGIMVGDETQRVTPSSVKILADMRRCAFDLDFLISRQPRNSLTTVTNTPRAPGTPAPHRNVGPSDFEYLDVFGFFNMPRVPVIPSHAQQEQQQQQQQHLDGLDVTHAAHANHNGAVNMGGVSADISGAGGGTSGAEVPTAGAAGATPVAQMTNEFNITNYLIPTPESDWLFRNPS
ncbi:hypothetical protein AJ80_00392 [Polytolypa hystricis UAMH7299]|uniref:Zn(2)-C6 fungal-type domain-containing protein n=1 Tax=Polytolypa hystricis (strain UAMH7299) TaxID=1447883 RepID=A0A2B7Z451_POLH7|nr:hypothetical protein AJ80_00392 [Polytolypa hystricis UAMH7299]